MNSKSCSSRELLRPANRQLSSAHRLGVLVVLSAFATLVHAPAARGGDAPAWMHALVNAPLPKYDEKMDAVLLYTEEILNVQSNGKIKSTTRRAYKILRPDGRRFGRIHAFFDGETRITNIHGWCIPAQGKDYEVKDKEALEMGLNDIENGLLLTDERMKVLQIPAADVGNTIGYEIEQEDRPYILQDIWDFQSSIPVREARYTLQLPTGWEYKATWLNYPEVKSASSGGNQWQWVVADVAAIKRQERMPPWRGIAGVMIVSIFPPGGGQSKGFSNWKDMGYWEAGLEMGRRDPSPEIKQKVAALTTTPATQLAKMQALAKFVQGDIRYVAIELGIGGWQPHAAQEIFTHRYGDCKDKATLMSSMLHEIGIESFYISINTVRGGATPDRPPMVGWFNHEILAVKLPEEVKDPSLVAVLDHPKLGRLLIFDPTDEYTPFGYLRGELQSNYGLLVTPEGGDLVKLPQLPPAMSGVERTGKMTLSPRGTLSGEIVETRLGDSGWWQRAMLKSVTKEADKIKPIENLASSSLSTFQITKATVLNLNQTDQPFGYQYSLVAENYAKTAGELLLVRPRVLGSKTSDILETKEPRQFAVELPGPERDTDTFEITIPAGYEVDDLPPPINADYSFASYHSKTEVNGNTLKYTRTFEVKELSVPLSKVEDLKKFYRIIAGDERNTAVLKPVSH
jgi:hypothetical protein